ncbi:MAG: hypothetical protein ABSB49_00585 [Polyangia bacterium]|jgi:hypothetical protein
MGVSRRKSVPTGEATVRLALAVGRGCPEEGTPSRSTPTQTDQTGQTDQTNDDA